MIIHSEFIFNDLFKKNNNFEQIKIKNKVQQLYSDAFYKLDFNKVICNKCKSVGNFEIKGYYYRTIIVNNISVKIRITRIKCKDCGKTHAIFFLDIVPYYPLSSINCERIILNHLIDDLMDEQALYRFKRRVSTFNKRIKDILLSVYLNTIEEITIGNINYRKQSYLQIHRGIVMLHISS